MKVLRYGEKVIAAGAHLPDSGTRDSCSIPDCTENVQFYIEFRGSSKRRVELCATHMLEARNSDIEFDRQAREFLAAIPSKSTSSGL